MTSPVKRIFSSTLQLGISHFLNTIQQLVLTPLFLRSWGADVYGEWLVIFATISYLSLMDFGIGNYIVNKLSFLWSKNDLKGFLITYHSGFLISLILGSIFTMVVLAISWYFTFLNPLHMTHINKNSNAFFFTMFFLGMELVLRISLNIAAGIYIGTGMYPRTFYRKNQEMLIVIIGSILLLLLGYKWLAISMVRLGGTILILGVSFLEVKRLFPEIKHGLARSEKKEAIAILKQGSWFMGLTSAHMIQNSGSIIAVQYFSGPAAVTTFSIMRTLVNLVSQIRQMPCPSFLRESITFYARKEYVKIRVIYKTLQKFAIYISIFLCTILFFKSKTLLHWWVGDKVFYDQFLMTAFLFFILLQSSWLISELFLLAWNKPKKAAIFHNMSSICGVSVGALLAVYFQGTGMVIGLIIGELAIVKWLIPRMVENEIGQSTKEMWKEIWAPSIITGIACFFAPWVVVKFHVNSSVEFVAVISMVTLALGSFVWKIGLSSYEKGKIVQLAKGAKTKLISVF